MSDSVLTQIQGAMMRLLEPHYRKSRRRHNKTVGTFGFSVGNTSDGVQVVDRVKTTSGLCNRIASQKLDHTFSHVALT